MFCVCKRLCGKNIGAAAGPAVPPGRVSIQGVTPDLSSAAPGDFVAKHMKTWKIIIFSFFAVNSPEWVDLDQESETQLRKAEKHRPGWAGAATGIGERSRGYENRRDDLESGRNETQPNAPERKFFFRAWKLGNWVPADMKWFMPAWKRQKPSFPVANLHLVLYRYFRFSASSSSSVRGQSEPSSRERLRSASTLPPVWHAGQ